MSLLRILRVCRALTTAVAVSVILVLLVAGGAHAQGTAEIVGLRDATSKTHDLGGGKREWVGYSEPVHYKDKNGAYQEIDNSLVAENARIDGVDYAFRNGANLYSVWFASKSVEAGLVRIESQGKSVSFGPEGTRASDATKTADASSRMLTEMTYGQSLLTYPEAFPGVDLLYEPKSLGVKEYLVLKGPEVQNDFTFNLSSSGLTAKETSGRISFLDDQGEEVFWVGNLFAVDNAGVSTDAVTCSLVQDGGRYQLKVTVDKAYLSAAERAYPVVVDPTVIISSSATPDSFVSSLYPNNNYYLQSYLRTGNYTDYGIRRTYIKFDLSGLSNIYADNVTAAWVRLEKYGGGGTPQVAGYRVTGSWTSSTITWNNKPGYSTATGDHSDYAYNDSGAWWRMDNCATLVRNWLRGTYSNYGLCIKDHVEDGTVWTHFYSSDAASPHKPELHIQYIYCGVRPYQSQTSQNINCAGYALNTNGWENFGIDLSAMAGYTTAQCLTYTENKVDQFLNAWIPGHTHIAGYQSDVPSDYNRIVLRVGFDDANANGRYDYSLGEDWDFHFWYQTMTGAWAEKHGSLPSQYAAASNAWSDPENYSWNLGTYSYFYDSDAWYIGEWY